MRFEGTLTQWNDDRGFGSITPTPAGQDVFVHVSAFARDGQRPQLHEALSFEIALNKDGKKQAVAVRRHGAAGGQRQAAAGKPRRAEAPSATTARTLPTRIVLLVLACAVMAAAYWQFDRRQHNVRAAQVESAAEAFLQQPPAGAAAGNAPVAPLSSFRCDGRQHCSQMTTCAEAQYFLKNCPDVKMDGDGDGVPCEQQLCTGPLGG